MSIKNRTGSQCKSLYTKLKMFDGISYDNNAVVNDKSIKILEDKCNRAITYMIKNTKLNADRLDILVNYILEERRLKHETIVSSSSDDEDDNIPLALITRKNLPKQDRILPNNNTQHLRILISSDSDSEYSSAESDDSDDEFLPVLKNFVQRRKSTNLNRITSKIWKSHENKLNNKKEGNYMSNLNMSKCSERTGRKSRNPTHRLINNLKLNNSSNKLQV